MDVHLITLLLSLFDWWPSCHGRQMLDVVSTNTVFSDRTFAAVAARVWNGLPDTVGVFSVWRRFRLAAKDIFDAKLRRGSIDVEVAPLSWLTTIITHIDYVGRRE